ncbi:substrate-binding periplasmic protein [Burkholderiaceae bacterium UC74_6]
MSLVGALLLAGQACAASPSLPPLVFAFSELAPWKTKTADGGDFGGAYTLIVRELARRLGRDLRIVECPHARCMLMLRVGEADLTIGVQQSPERDAYLAFLRTPYRKSASDRVFYVRRGEAKRIRRYEDLRDLHIGIKQGSEYFDRFDEDTTLHKEIALSNSANLRKLVLRRLDAVVMPEDQGAVLMNEPELRGQLEAAVYRERDLIPRSVAVSRKSAAIELLPQLEAAMQAMRRDGTLAAIYDKHYFERYRVSRKQLRLD